MNTCLTKCMSSPQMLARSLSWAGNSGKPSAIMAIDIKDDSIGLALAYHRKVRPSPENNVDTDNTANTKVITSIHPLPPLPYMSSNPHHPSYSFQQHSHTSSMIRPMASEDDEMSSSEKPPRSERTAQIALQLAQISIQRNVKSILVRWPGEGMVIASDEQHANHHHNGKNTNTTASVRVVDNHKVIFYNTLGYQRGKILYVLDKCCGDPRRVYGQDPAASSSSSSSTSLLMEGIRPFALWDDTTAPKKDVITTTLSSRLDPTRSREIITHSTNRNINSTDRRMDKYGNSMTEMDMWGRAPIFGMPPDSIWRRQCRYPDDGPNDGMSVAMMQQQKHQPSGSSFGELSFDQFHDAEAKIDQLKGSFAAMLTLRDFADAHLEGRVALPVWVELHDDGIDREDEMKREEVDDVHVGYRKEEWRSKNDGNTKVDDWRSKNEDSREKRDLSREQKVARPSQQETKGKKLATLVQMPRKRRSRGEQSAQLNGRE